MSLRSMTGFGVASRAWDDADLAASHTVHVEIRSVNGRYRELKVRQPFGPAVEHELRRRVAQVVGRGRVDVAVTLRRAGPGEAVSETHALQQVGLDPHQIGVVVAAVREAERLTGQRGLELDPPNALEIFRFCVAQQAQGTAEVEHPPRFLGALVDEALQGLSGLREREGEALTDELTRLLEQLRRSLAALRQRLDQEPSRALAKATQRLSALCADAGIPDPEQTRIRQEVAQQVLRGDVTEELARLDSHIGQMGALIRAPAQSGDGKTLDFLCQELFREISTIGSKIADVDGSAMVIELKRTVESLREQVQNVE